MKTFTISQIVRQSAKLLDAVDKNGLARVKRLDGRSYFIRPESRKSDIKGR